MEIICPICWEPLEYGRILATTCGHIFHEQCIVAWTLRSHCCPECRYEPTFPMRVINFTWQEEIDSQEKHMLDSAELAGSSESDLLRKTMSAKSDILSDMEEMQTNPAKSPKSIEIESDQRSEAGCDVCNRFNFLMEKAIQLRDEVKEYEKAHQAGSRSPTSAEKLKYAECSGPEAKRRRSN